MLTDLIKLDIDEIAKFNPDGIIALLRRPVSGTYRSPTPAGSGSILELRVDVEAAARNNV